MKKFFPLVCFWMMDHPEQMKICGIKDHPSTNRPCHTCEIPFEELSNPNSSETLRRSSTTQTRRLDAKALEDYSLHPQDPLVNRFLVSGLGVYSSTPLCRLHLMDLGMVRYSLKFVAASIAYYNSRNSRKKILQEFNDRFKRIPYYSTSTYPYKCTLPSFMEM